MESQNKLKLVTSYEPVPPLAFYLRSRKDDPYTRWHQINKCAICQCELYDIEEDDESEKDLKKAHAAIVPKLMAE